MAINLLNNILNEPSTRERRLLSAEEMPELETPTPELHPQTDMTFTEAELESRVVQVNKNTDQRLIIVTQDKAVLTLKKNVARLGRRDWVAPLSTVLTILIALLTSSFQPTLWLSSAEWRAMFIISGLISTGWLAYTIKKALDSKGFHEVIRDIVLELGSKRIYR